MTAHLLDAAWTVFDSWAEHPSHRGVQDRNIAVRPASGAREQICVVGRCSAMDVTNQQRALDLATHIVATHNRTLA